VCICVCWSVGFFCVHIPHLLEAIDRTSPNPFASFASPRGPTGLLSPRIDHIKSGFKARSVVGGTKGWGRGKGGENHSTNMMINLDRFGQQQRLSSALNPTTTTTSWSGGKSGVTHGPNGLAIKSNEKRTATSLPDMRTRQDFGHIGMVGWKRGFFIFSHSFLLSFHFPLFLIAQCFFPISVFFFLSRLPLTH
jgi:hypothetical protein